MQDTPSIIGVTSGYVPEQYPKTVYDSAGKTALARDPGHQAELEKAGYAEDYVAPPQVAKAVEATVATAGKPGELADAQSAVKQLTAELFKTLETHGREVADHLNLNAALKAELDLVKSEFGDFRNKAVAAALAAVETPVPVATPAPEPAPVTDTTLPAPLKLKIPLAVPTKK